MTNPPPSSTPDPAVELLDVSKRYVLMKQKPYLVHELFKRLRRAHLTRELFWSLRDVSLTVRPGESVGVIGRNGAGKSTLLGLVAGAIAPTCGSVRVSGRVGALLELGAGFHPDLTGRENIYLNASLLGLSRQDVDQRFESILDFSELREFIDTPIRSYSSGMYIRLGFSVAVHARPEVLLIDEALAVGDEDFQAKCMARILEFQRAGVTLLFVSHNMQQVQNLCPRTVLLDAGRVRFDGPTAEAIARYRDCS